MDCTNCGAPLPPDSNICSHCDTVNDLDLRATRAPIVKGPKTDRICPHCDIRMHSVNLGLGKGIYVEQCEQCTGIFLDPNELESIFDAAVSSVYEIDHRRLAELIEGPVADFPTEVKYVECPECGTIMNRRIFGAKSGVIIDSCKGHGIWLDAGELRQLLHWVKAGGHKHDQKKKEQERRDEERKRRLERPEILPSDSDNPMRSDDLFPFLPSAIRFLINLLG